MVSNTRSKRNRKAAAFTLIELLLTVSLVLLLAGVVIINFSRMEQNSRLEEGATHFETLFRYARAQAASTGRRVQIVFGPEISNSGSLAPSTNSTPDSASLAPGVQVLWEPDPVDAPGRFEAMPGSELLVDQVNDLVKVNEVYPPGMNSNGVSTNEPPSLTPSFSMSETNQVASTVSSAATQPPLNCYPDGSSDSLEIKLSAANGEDKRVAVVTLSGLNGATRHRMVSTNEDVSLSLGDSFTGNSPRDR